MGSNHLSPAPPVGVGVFIATPTFQAPVTAYTYSLGRTMYELGKAGIPCQLGIPDDVKNVDDGRNLLVRDFLQSSCTDILFIDADMMFEPASVLRILSWNEDVVCGAYRYKSDSGTYPVGRILETDERTKLLTVSYAPTGFMRIRRKVFEQLRDSQPKSGGTAFFFQRKFNGNTYDGGDVNFCRKWIAAGGKVKVDPTLPFAHVGTKRWGGRFIDYLADDENRAKHLAEESDPNLQTSAEPASNGALIEAKNELNAVIDDLKKGQDSLETFIDLANAYGNKPWALSPEGLKLIWDMALGLKKGATILECGAGVSSLVLALAAKKVGAKLVILEESMPYAERIDGIAKEFAIGLNIRVAKVQSGWYGPNAAPGLEANMIVIDGPVRKPGVDRLWPLRKQNLEWNILAPDAAVIIDDADDLMKAQLAKDVVGGWVAFDEGTKPMMIGRMGEKAKEAVA